MKELTEKPGRPERAAERRRVPRIFFKATTVVAEAGSQCVVIAQTTELSRFGCFVLTSRPYPRGTRIQIELAESGAIFAASGVVAYVTAEGMGIVFSVIAEDNGAVLESWLARAPQRFTRQGIGASAHVRDLGAGSEQVVVTSDVSARGCFVKTIQPLAKGSHVRVRITHKGEEFAALAKVTENVRPDGMGMEFIEIEPRDRAILDGWLADETIVR
jgi:hypothetical protein